MQKIRLGFSVLALVISLSVTSAAAGKDNYPRFLTDCGNESACVKMDINFGKKSPKSVVAKRKELGDGHSDFLLKVRGKLAGKSEKAHRVWFKAFTDGMDCNGFGQGMVPSKGFSSKGNPILLTDKGELELTDSSLRIGCSGCLKLYDGKSRQLVKTLVSPATDTTSAGYEMEDFSYNEKGEILLRTKKECLVLDNKRKFETRPSNNFRRMKNIGSYEKKVGGFVFEPGEWLFEVPGSKYLLFMVWMPCG